MRNKVYLVGGGPGDPGLITLKGVECIRRADVVIYDYLASRELLAHAASDAELIYVGKKGGDHTLSQENINRLIVEKAKAGRIVTRLKGGDPFIFGRGGEEAEELIREDIPFEVVPGVTSAIAAPAYAGIPLTHRHFTSSVAFITGHEDPTKTSSNIDWPALAKGIGTLVFLMGVKNLPTITRRLLENGMSPEKPIALVRWGSTPHQVTVTGTLASIVEKVKAAELKAPAIIVVGDVVALRQELKWFEKRPLWGKRIVVTRARKQASDLLQRLTDLGADCLECPTIKIAPPDDMQPLETALENLQTYDWLVFTSVNGVDFFFDRLHANSLDARALSGCLMAVIGPATKDRLASFGIQSDLMPSAYRAEAVVEAFQARRMRGGKVLLPRAKDARPILPEALRAMGAEVDEVVSYKAIPDTENCDQLLEALRQKTVDMVTFTSSSTVRNFKALFPAEAIETLTRHLTIAAIGPITANTAEELGFSVDIVSDNYTIPGLCDAICHHYLDKN